MKLQVTMIAVALSLSACGDDGDTNAEEGTPEQSAETPTAESPPAEAEPEAPAPDPTERQDTTAENHLPVSMASHVALASETEAVNLGSDFMQLNGPSGYAVSGAWGHGWTTLSGAEPAVALYQHNPAGDDGEDCPSLDTIKQAIGDASVVTEQRAAIMWEGEGPAYGDEIDLLVFTRGEATGFYVRKRFDHGDDYTDFCGAFGAEGSAFDMSATGTMDQAKAAAAALLTTRENL